MKYGDIKSLDISNGSGIRVSLFVSGCNFHCKNCFNQEAQSYSYGEFYTQDTKSEILSLVSSPHIAGLSILGGDPMWQTNEDIMELIELCKEVHKLNKTVWIWTGFIWEDIFTDRNLILDDGTINNTFRQELAKQADVLIDGPFVDKLKDLTLHWKGSSNQRVIDVKESLKANKVILYKES